MLSVDNLGIVSSKPNWWSPGKSWKKKDGLEQSFLNFTCMPPLESNQIQIWVWQVWDQTWNSALLTNTPPVMPLGLWQCPHCVGSSRLWRLSLCYLSLDPILLMALTEYWHHQTSPLLPQHSLGWCGTRAPGDVQHAKDSSERNLPNTANITPFLESHVTYKCIIKKI